MMWKLIDDDAKAKSTKVDLWCKFWIPSTDTFGGMRITDCFWNQGNKQWYVNRSNGTCKSLHELQPDVHPTHYFKVPEPPIAERKKEP